MDRDYIIAFDENGEPYIAHALGSRLSGAASNARRAGSRYLMKIQTRYGNRYFYTPEEVQAYQRAKSGVKKATDSAKSTVNSTKKHVNQTVKTLKSDLKKRRTWKNAEKEASSNLKPLRSSPDSRLKRYESEDEKAYDKAFAAATKKTYDKTKLGKAESAVKSATDRMKEEFRKKADTAKSGAKTAVKEITGQAAKERMNETKKKLDRATEDVDNANERMIDAHIRENERRNEYEQNLHAKKGDKYDPNSLVNYINTSAAKDRAIKNADKAHATYEALTDKYEADRKAYERSVTGLSDKLKDEIGVDEKKSYENAVNNYDEKKKKAQELYEQVQELDHQYRRYLKTTGEKRTKEEQQRADKMFEELSRAASNSIAANEQASKAGEDLSEAYKNFMLTPLGKLKK